LLKLKVEVRYEQENPLLKLKVGGEEVFEKQEQSLLKLKVGGEEVR